MEMEINVKDDSHLIGPGPGHLGVELLHALVQAAVAPQLGLNGGQVGAPGSLVHPPLVLLQPAQQVLNVA